MTSLFYGFSALLMAAAHYTLCDETSVVEASTGVSMWGDLAAGWLLANHNNLNVLLIVGIVWSGACIVGSILKSEIEKDDKIRRAVAYADWVAENERLNARWEERMDRQVIYATEDREREERINRCIARSDQIGELISNMMHSIDSIDERLAVKMANSTSVTPQIAPTATLSDISPSHNTHLLVDTSKRSYVGGVKCDWQKRMAAAEAAAALQVAAQTNLEDGEVVMELEEGEISPTEIRLHDFNCRYAEINQMKRKLFDEYPEIADQLDRPASRPRNA